MLAASDSTNRARAAQPGYTGGNARMKQEPTFFEGKEPVLIYRAVRAGAFFYVLPNAVAAAREVMIRNRYKPLEGEPG